MGTSARFVVLALCGVLLAPAAASAGSRAVVGGRGPRMHGLRAPPLVPKRFHDARCCGCRRAVPILVGDFTDIGRDVVAQPIVIQVDGDVEIVPLEGGGLRLVFGDEEE